MKDNRNSLLTSEDLYLFNEGTHLRLWDKLGARSIVMNGVKGAHFAVWAPNAERVSVVGDFNAWTPDVNPLAPSESSGIWEGFLPGLEQGVRYKYNICSRLNGYKVNKADPFGFLQETPPRTGSVLWDLSYDWNDRQWMASRAEHNGLESPMSIYEVHIGSWMRRLDQGGRPLNYREMADSLAEYVRSTNYTHVEFMPVMEHPFYGSWGYQTTGFFAPTSRYGTPQDFMHLVDVLHTNGIGVILDWVPSHFPSDEHGLGYFDGTHLFEHADLRQGLHPDWDSLIFNYGRNEVRSFLLSSALFWLEVYHADGIRVDAVASMLYLDYSRNEGDWVPNRYGGRENIEAIEFLRQLNTEIFRLHPDVQTIAEESTAWPMVSRPTFVGGLGFGMKWDMGWMHDTLSYISKDPVHRSYHHYQLTFRNMYTYSENFVLPLSHDEVVHGKSSIIGKMPGDYWQKFANVRLLLTYMFCQPGKKLLFMGIDIGQWNEWYHESSLDWHLLEYPHHAGLHRLVEDLNRLYRKEPALHAGDAAPGGFEWIDCNDSQQSTLSMIRRGHSEEDMIIAACNFTPVPRQSYRVGAPRGGYWSEIFNSDAALYGGSGLGNMGGVESAPVPTHGRPFSLTVSIPPLGAVLFKVSP